MITTTPVQHRLNQIIATVGELPPAPAIISSAIAVTSNLQADIAEISRILSSDQSLTAKILKLSNSPYYGRIKEVKTTNEAILVLGFETLRSIIIATSTYNLYSKGNHKLLQIRLWRHSLSAAISARQIADFLKQPYKEEIFVATLMHDIGKLVMLQKMSDWYVKIINEVEAKSESFRQIELRVLNFDHTDVASLLLGKWTFPQSLVESIKWHHEPPSFRRDGEIPISQIIHLANYMGKNLDACFNDKKYEDLTQIESGRAMGLNKESLEEIFDEAKEHFRAEIKIFEGS